MVRPTAGAIIRKRCISSANCSGKQRLRAIRQSVVRIGMHLDQQRIGPRGYEAQAMGATLSRNPVPCEGSDVIGRCDSLCTMGMAEMSSVLRV